MAVKNPTPSWRIGLGYDIHRTQPGDHVWLGGVRVAAPFSLVGHSDADVLLHAVTDAILGALSDYDIGYYFPPTAMENRNRKSSEFLAFVVERMDRAGYCIANLDCNIICEEPRIAPVRDDIRASLSRLLRISITRASVKGRTNEGVGAIGAKAAIACQAIVLLTANGENQ